MEIEDSELEILEVDNTAVRASQIERINKTKKNRDSEKVVLSLQKLIQACKNGDENLLELSIDAARNRATLGEISDAMEEVFGRYIA